MTRWSPSCERIWIRQDFKLPTAPIFNIGDEVECIQNHHGPVSIGARGIVMSVESELQVKWREPEKSPRYGLFYSYPSPEYLAKYVRVIEKSETPRFQVGDDLVLRKPLEQFPEFVFVVGLKGRVTEIQSGGVVVVVWETVPFPSWHWPSVLALYAEVVPKLLPKPLSVECPCGILRVACDYHRPEGSK